MVKIAIIADSHLIHAYHSDYDKMEEFKRLVEEINSQEPVAILVLGDFFDKKFSNQGHPISHIEGAKHQLPITEIIDSIGVPWYSLLGNHEDKSVLELLSKTAKNFNFLLTDPKSGLTSEAKEFEKPLIIDGVRFWFGNIQEEENHRIKELKIKEYCQAAAKLAKDKNILLLHIDMVRRGEDVGITKELVQLMSKNFNLVFNGHEHTFQTKVDGFNNVILAPASLPTWIGIREGLIAKYEFIDNKLKKKENKLKDPRGYLLLDTNTLKINFKPFHSTMPAVSVLYDVTDKDLVIIGNEWRKIAENLKQELVGQRNIKSIIIIPILTGNLGSLLPFEINSTLEMISNEISDIHIVDIRKKDLKTPSLDIEAPDETEILNLEGVFSRTLDQAEEVVERLSQMKISLTANQVKKIINRMRIEDSNFFFEKGTKNIKTYAAEIVNILLADFNEILERDWKNTDIMNIIDNSFE
ncbi:MAG: metallophosphoesterase family protein [Promethearchaeota archaeon]